MTQPSNYPEYSKVMENITLSDRIPQTFPELSNCEVVWSADMPNDDSRSGIMFEDGYFLFIHKQENQTWFGLYWNDAHPTSTKFYHAPKLGQFIFDNFGFNSRREVIIDNSVLGYE